MYQVYVGFDFFTEHKEKENTEASETEPFEIVESKNFDMFCH